MNYPHKNNPYQKARKKANLTQEKAVESLPVEVCSLQYYEAGQRHPNMNCAQKMAELYGCSVNDFAQRAGGDIHE